MQKNKWIPIYFMIILLMSGLQSCNSIEQTIPGTPTPTLTATSTPEPTFTPTPTSTLTPTSTPNLIATQQYEAFYPSIEEYYQAGYISTKDGTYTSLEDYTVSSPFGAGFYQWELFDTQASQFILQTIVSIDTQSRDGGCGFIFHYSDTSTVGTQKVIYLRKDGYVGYFIHTWDFDTPFAMVDRALIADLTKIKLTLIVYEKKTLLLVNNKLAISINITPTKNAGLGLATFSDSEKDIRTTCSFKNIDLWTFEN